MIEPRRTATAPIAVSSGPTRRVERRRPRVGASSTTARDAPGVDRGDDPDQRRRAGPSPTTPRRRRRPEQRDERPPARWRSPPGRPARSRGGRRRGTGRSCCGCGCPVRTHGSERRRAIASAAAGGHHGERATAAVRAAAPQRHATERSAACRAGDHALGWVRAAVGPADESSACPPHRSGPCGRGRDGRSAGHAGGDGGRPAAAATPSTRRSPPTRRSPSPARTCAASAATCSPSCGRRTASVVGLNATGRAGSGADAAALRAEGHTRDADAPRHPRRDRARLRRRLDCCCTSASDRSTWRRSSPRPCASPRPASRRARCSSRSLGMLDDDARRALRRARRAGDAPGRPRAPARCRAHAAGDRRPAVGTRSTAARSARASLALGDGYFTEADLATRAGRLGDAADRAARAASTWHTIGPNSQGYLFLGAAGLADALGVPAGSGGRRRGPHLLVEAAATAGFDRPDVLHDGADGAALRRRHRGARRPRRSRRGPAAGPWPRRRRRHDVPVHGRRRRAWPSA